MTEKAKKEAPDVWTPSPETKIKKNVDLQNKTNKIKENKRYTW